jgi:hypothetical protein
MNPDSGKHAKTRSKKKVIKNISRPMKSIIAATAAVGILALAGAAPTFAAGNTNATFTLTGTPASAASSSFSSFTGTMAIDGSSHNVASSLNIGTITDNSGAGAGWNLTLNLGRFVNANEILPASSLTVTTASSITPEGSASATGVLALDGSTTAVALDTSSDIVIASAAVGDGMGTYAFSSVTVGLTVPANSYAGAYDATGTATFTAVAP